MHRQRLFQWTIMLCAVWALSLSATPLSRAAPLEDADGPTLDYAGRLTDLTGQPVADGSYDLQFELFDSETAGRQIWSQVSSRIPVQNGQFETDLGSVTPLPNLAQLPSLWLAVSVRGPGEEFFTPLNPRQILAESGIGTVADTQADAACAHDHWGDTWTGSGAAGLILENPQLTHTVYAPSLLSALFAVSETWAGVYGKSTANIGILGESVNGTGVQGKSQNGPGGFFESAQDDKDLTLGGHIGRINTDPADQNSNLILSANNNVDIRLDNDGGEDGLFTIWGSATEACNVTESGNLKCFGTKSAVVETAQHGARQLYAIESPEVWFEDMGSAALANGETFVPMEPIFAETVDLTQTYHVYLTPICQEPVLLFVTSKEMGGFGVEGVGLDGNPSSCEFDYRIAAKRAGYAGQRLLPDAARREVAP